jgi:fructose-bisphosphate aldolase, class I
MNTENLESIAQRLISPGKGILAADETAGTLTKRFEQLKIPSTPETRREYRELLFSTPGVGTYVSGVIMYDETIHQRTSNGEPLAEFLKHRGMIPGIKVDTGAKPLSGFDEETITEGLDGLRDRLQHYHSLGAQFAKWRAVIRISDVQPTDTCINANADALARYAALCQEQRMVPIVEPEVLMEGSHTIERCYEVTGNTLHTVFSALYEYRVLLEGMLLKPNMVVSGSTCPVKAPSAEVASTTLRCLSRHVPAAVPGIVFLSGGQTEVMATANLNSINQVPGKRPWSISFSYGRALQDSALATWLGIRPNIQSAQEAFYRRAHCNSAASLGKYSESMESSDFATRAIQAHSEAGDD